MTNTTRSSLFSALMAIVLGTGMGCVQSSGTGESQEQDEGQAATDSALTKKTTYKCGEALDAAAGLAPTDLYLEMKYVSAGTIPCPKTMEAKECNPGWSYDQFDRVFARCGESGAWSRINEQTPASLVCVLLGYDEAAYPFAWLNVSADDLGADKPDMGWLMTWDGPALVIDKSPEVGVALNRLFCPAKE
jgi:hypothetical protein